MLTDDPGTPGDGHLETNIAATVEAGEHEQLWQLPVIDLNYGVGEHIQLNFETSFHLLKRDDEGPIGGPGSASVAVKWRFADQENFGLSMSAYPRIEWNPLHSSVRRGLVDDGTHVFLPLEAARQFGHFDLDGEIGSLLSSVGRSQWVYGIVGGTAVTSKSYVMAELHGSARANFDRDRLSVNIGLRQKLNSHLNLISSLGTDVRSPPGERILFISYLGAQLEY